MRWIDRKLAESLHDRLVQRFGGAHGVRDVGLLESALARPQMLAVYQEEADLAVLAASLGFELAKNHPFADGNKRTALLCMATFLTINSTRFEPDPVEAVQVMVEVASSDLLEERLAAWIRANISPPA